MNVEGNRNMLRWLCDALVVTSMVCSEILVPLFFAILGCIVYLCGIAILLVAGYNIFKVLILGVI